MEMHFFGVRTDGSSALRLFPGWVEALGLGEAVLTGVDLPLDAPAARYREAVERLKNDPAVAGALVTSHKLNVVRAAHDLFDGFTDEAALCGEVSAIYKRGGKLYGHAADPLTSGLAMDRLLGADYWKWHPGAEILAFGAGGASVAMVVYLLTQARYRPASVTLVDVRADQLAYVARLLDRVPDRGVRFKLVEHRDPAENDRLVGDLPPHALVINATGMGKDLPGSPVTDAAVFPERGAVWELNYRGERRFLQQARRQADAQALHVEDGWYYFLLGWSTVMSYVFDVEITPERFARFAAASEAG
jgi:shikimate 5-dehydrogenase